MQAAAGHARHEERDGDTGLAGCYPQAASLLAGRKVPERPGVVLGDLGHADVTEHLPGGLVYRLHGGELGHLGCPYQHHIIVAADGSGINLVRRIDGAALFRPRIHDRVHLAVQVAHGRPVWSLGLAGHAVTVAQSGNDRRLGRA
jgi:hypothetical protein